ncbi:hypothetical protein [uncultured Stenotrophomonas sp.]|uniref:hypothetical protein n=1 Tax=uncultured Stenotrophomonas sp. TaxID=165438 RepID=UPI0025DA20C0|nr:hypothetical protein [uncultured Stenotrophomonas sp.]
MQARKFTLVEIGGSDLPSLSPAAPRYTNWFPVPYRASVVPPVDGVTPNPVADGVLIEWTGVDQEGVIYVIERGPTEQGPWTEIRRTTETRYLYSDGSGQKWWFRITPTVRGKPGASSVVGATPPTTTADLIEQQEKLAAETLERMRADAAEATARAEDMAQAAQDLLAEAKLRQQQYADAMQGISDEARARAEALLNEKLEREAAITREQQLRQSADESLARAVSEVAAGSGTQFDSIKLWPFNQTAEGWTGNGAPTLVDGWLRPANHATAPWVQSPVALAIDGSAYRFVKLRVKRVGSPAWSGVLQWITATDQAWNTQKRAAIPEPAWDSTGVATVDVQDIAWWPAKVDAIRLQMGAAQAVSSYFLIDYVAVGRPQPGASMAVVQAETEARITSDAAEAAQRNTLAIQMRGNYTGTDPLQLTAGLAYEELRARVAADSAQVQRISTMEARMPAGAGSLATAASVTALQEATTTTTNALAQSITTINATLPAMIAQGSNMVVNGGWQSGRDVGWSYDSATMVVAPTEGRAGGACFRADGANGVRRATANGSVASGRDVTVSPGRKYRYGCWYKTTADFNGTADNSKLRLATQADALIGGATPFLPGKTEWTYVGLVYTVADSTSITALRLMFTMNHTIGTLWVDDVSLEEVTDVIANAEGLQALTTTVNNQGGQINSQAGLISALRTDVDGKASNAALQSLQSQVTLQGNSITSLGTAITNVNASLSNIGGDNLLPNSSFETSSADNSTLPDWFASNSIAQVVSYAATYAVSGSARAIQIVASAPATAAGQYIGVEVATANRPKPVPGTKYTLSAWVSRMTATAGRVQLLVQWLDANNAGIGSAQYAPVSDLTSTMVRYTGTFTAPTGAVSVRVFVRIASSAVGDSLAAAIDNVMFQQGEVATNWMPSGAEAAAKINANAAATSTLQGQVTSIQGTVTAQGTAITIVNAEIARGRNTIWPVGTFEAWSDGTVLVSNAAGGTNYTVRNAAARNGARGLEINVTANNSPTSNADMYIGEFVPVSGNRVIYVEFYARLAPESIDNPTGSFGIGVNTQSETGSNNWPRTNDANNTLSKTAWTKRSAYLTLNASSARMRVFMSIPSTGRQVGTIIQVDDVIWQDVTDAQAAQATAAGAASGVSSLRATVTQQGQAITAQAGRIDGVQASVAGKADASVVQEMRVQVNNQGSGGNLLANSLFANWSINGYLMPGGWIGGRNLTGNDTNFIPYGLNSAFAAFRAGTFSEETFGWTPKFPIKANATYCVQFGANTHRSRILCYLEYYDGAGNPVGQLTPPESINTGLGGFSLANAPLYSAIGKAPATAVQAAFVYRFGGIGQADGYIWMWRPMVSEVAEGATTPPPWSAGGGEATAQWNLSVQADGISAGLQLGVTGQTSAFNILSSAVNILTPGGADGFELTNGYLRVWAGNSQRIIGNNFGADGLVDYFGPNVGAANANKTNATMWMDRNGNAYWGGAIAAGILRNAAQSTTTQTIGNSVLVGPFDTNGRNKQVVVGYNRRHTRIKNGFGPDGFVAGAGSNSGVINLYRQLNGQNETLWQQIPISGRVDIFNEPDSSDRADSYWSASVTLNDSSDGATRRSYRAEIVSYSEQSVTHQSGSFTSQTITQSLSIVSIEQ